MKLNVRAFGLTFALVWGFGLFVITWWIIFFDGVTNEVTLVGQIYRGYTVSPQGSFIGLIWGLADGFVGGIIIAWLYNLFAGRFGGQAQSGTH